MKANYEEDKVIVSATEPTGVNRKKVWFKKGKNLIKEIILDSSYNENETSILYNQPNFARTDFIQIEHNVDYIFSHSLGTGNGYIIMFDKNFDYIGGINHETITTKFNITNVNVKYIMIVIWSTTINTDTNIMLEQNTVATTYEAYVEPEIYILNSNNVYERFYSEDQFFYRAGENIYIPAGYIAPGYITGSAKDIKFNIELNKNANKLNSVSCSRLIANIRHVGGGYVVAGDTDFATYISSINVFNDKYVGIVLSNPNGWGITNNTPVLIQLSGQTIISTS